MKTSLCNSCSFSKVTEWDCGYKCDKQHINVKCLVVIPADDPHQPVIACNRYRKEQGKTTYHDPDFNEYANKVEVEDGKQ